MVFKKKPEEFVKRMEPVASKVPKSFVDLFNEHIKRVEYNTISDWIRDLMRKDLKMRGLLS